jgi:hypothetical protein
MLPIGSFLVAEKPIYNFLTEKVIKILPISEHFSSVGYIYYIYIGGGFSSSNMRFRLLLPNNTSRYSLYQSTVLIYMVYIYIYIYIYMLGEHEVGNIYKHTTKIFNTE